MEGEPAAAATPAPSPSEPLIQQQTSVQDRRGHHTSTSTTINTEAFAVTASALGGLTATEANMVTPTRHHRHPPMASTNQSKRNDDASPDTESQPGNRDETLPTATTDAGTKDDMKIYQTPAHLLNFASTLSRSPKKRNTALVHANEITYIVHSLTQLVLVYFTDKRWKTGHKSSYVKMFRDANAPDGRVRPPQDTAEGSSTTKISFPFFCGPYTRVSLEDGKVMYDPPTGNNKISAMQQRSTTDDAIMEEKKPLGYPKTVFILNPKKNDKGMFTSASIEMELRQVAKFANNNQGERTPRDPHAYGLAPHPNITKSSHGDRTMDKFVKRLHIGHFLVNVYGCNNGFYEEHTQVARAFLGPPYMGFEREELGYPEMQQG